MQESQKTSILLISYDHKNHNPKGNPSRAGCCLGQDKRYLITYVNGLYWYE